MHEIAWTRILALVLGPTTYAFAATLAAVIAGVAIGSWLGTWLPAASRRPGSVAGRLAAGRAPSPRASPTRWPGARCRSSWRSSWPRVRPARDDWIARGAWLTAALILPTAVVCLGAAFPLALAIAGATAADVSGRVGLVYAVNTVGAVSGSLAAGFLLIPRFGLQATLQRRERLPGGGRARGRGARRARRARVSMAGAAAAAAALVALVASPPWDRELLASGAYLYAPFVPKDLDLEALLKAGTLLYYKEGAAATVSVKTLTGTTTLAVDGKTDASNRGDMLTQKLVAHLPLLLHDAPREVAIVGLGSGVTVGAALTPSRRARGRARALARSRRGVGVLRAPRTATRWPTRARGSSSATAARICTSRAQRYDVIISEPSNPWIAGVAALFTREFFAEARDRLTPGGVFCQWANAYNIGAGDLQVDRRHLPARVSRRHRLADRRARRALRGHGAGWRRRGHARRAGPPRRHRPALDPRRRGRRSAAGRGGGAVLAVVALRGRAGRARALRRGRAALLTDDRMTLEFSAPREIHRRSGGENGAALLALLTPEARPMVLARAESAAGAAAWRQRALCSPRSDVHTRAYDDFVRALRLDPDEAGALDGLVRSAALLKRSPRRSRHWTGWRADRAPSLEQAVARSKLLAAGGDAAGALAVARTAAVATPPPAGGPRAGGLARGRRGRRARPRCRGRGARGGPSRARGHGLLRARWRRS